VCCSVLQCVAVSCKSCFGVYVLMCLRRRLSYFHSYTVLPCVAVCCSVCCSQLQCMLPPVAARHSMLRQIVGLCLCVLLARQSVAVCVAMCYSVCCSALQCAVSCSVCVYVPYGVATISRLLTIIGIFCRISSLLQGSSAKETCNFKEPTNLSHRISAHHIFDIPTKTYTYTHVYLYTFDFPFCVSYSMSYLCFAWYFALKKTCSDVSFAGYSLFYRALLQKRPILYGIFCWGRRVPMYVISHLMTIRIVIWYHAILHKVYTYCHSHCMTIRIVIWYYVISHKMYTYSHRHFMTIRIVVWYHVFSHKVCTYSHMRWLRLVGSFKS